MNTNLKLLAALIMGGSLAACGGSSGGDGPDNSSSSSSSSSSSVSSSSSSAAVDCEANPFDPACIEEDPVTEIDITNEEIPLHETFAVTGEGNQVALFFSADYKALNTAGANEDYVDDYPSFYYPTCCFWETDEETGEPTGNLIPDIDERQYVGLDDNGNGFFAFSSARWSIGQLQPDIVSDEESEDGDAKSKTTNAPVGSSWGELDLSVDYRVSFCLKDSGAAGAGTGGNLEVYVDNNSGGNQGHSIHGNQSLLMRTTAAALEAGNRVVIDVPGNVRLQDNDGVEVNLLGTTAEVFGTENSFLQMRVSSGGYAVISDLMVEHQDNLVTSYEPCVADSGLFEPTQLEGQPFTGLPLDVDFSLPKDEFFGDEGTTFLAFADDATQAFYSGTMGKSRFLLEDGVARFGNSNWTIGNRHLGDTSAEDTLEDLTGGLDLSEAYSVTIQIDALTDLTANPDAQFMIAVDNNTSNDGNSIHAPNENILKIAQSELATGELVINVPGEVTLNGDVIDTIDTHVGTERSFLRLRCPGNCGDAAEGNSNGIALSSIVIENQESAPAYLAEDYSAADAATFFSADYKATPTDPSVPMYAVTAGTDNIVVADGTLTMANARFTVGSLDNETSTAAEVQPNGSLDLTRPYRINLTVVEATSVDDNDPGNFQIYVDNNTTSSGNSIHGGDSKFEYSVGSHPNQISIIPEDGEGNPMGTATSFLQIRADSKVQSLVIDDLSIEYLD